MFVQLNKSRGVTCAIDSSESISKAAATLIVDLVFTVGNKIFFRISDGWGDATVQFSVYKAN